jgi:uncharacterized membrane protein YvbJ
MECPKCGKKNKKGEEKCVVCGKTLIKKNAKEKTNELIDSITSTIDVKAIKRAEKSIVYNLKESYPKLIASSIVLIVLIFTIVFLSIGFKSVSCTYKSRYDDYLMYRANINFNYKDNKITRFKMRQEFSTDSSEHKKEFKNLYDNMISNSKDKENYKHIVRSTYGNKHFTIVYNFSPKYIEQVEDYVDIAIDDYKTIDDFIKELEDIDFKCK